MNKILSILICILAAMPVFAANKPDDEVTLSNVQVSREKTTFVVSYDISMGDGLQSCNVALLLSTDAGKNYHKVNAGDLSGDYGKIVSSGRKTIRYDFLRSKEKLADKQLAFKVEVTGKTDSFEKKVDISTNLFDWLDFATINADASIPVSRHFTVQAGIKFNPWNFKSRKGPDSQVHNKQQTISVGTRYWPWGTYSKLWICSKVQFSNYSITGVWRPALEEGKALGAGLSLGYMWRIGDRIGIEVGGGFWGGGLLEHSVYAFPGGDFRERGPKGFIAINDLTISFHWIF